MMIMKQKTNEEIPYRPLGVIMSMINNLGFEVTHSHDDLIFIKHNAFLIQMGEQGKDIFVWFNVDCVPEKTSEILEGLGEQATNLHLTLYKKGLYDLVANKEAETIQIEFLPQ